MMEMSDVFTLPLKIRIKPEDGETFIHDQKATVMQVYCDASGNQSEYVVHAVNNHDQLTAENKRLRSRIKEIRDDYLRVMKALGHEKNCTASTVCADCDCYYGTLRESMDEFLFNLKESE